MEFANITQIIKESKSRLKKFYTFFTLKMSTPCQSICLMSRDIRNYSDSYCFITSHFALD